MGPDSRKRRTCSHARRLGVPRGWTTPGGAVTTDPGDSHPAGGRKRARKGRTTSWSRYTRAGRPRPRRREPKVMNWTPFRPSMKWTTVPMSAPPVRQRRPSNVIIERLSVGGAWQLPDGDREQSTSVSLVCGSVQVAALPEHVGIAKVRQGRAQVRIGGGGECLRRGEKWHAQHPRAISAAARRRARSPALRRCTRDARGLLNSSISETRTRASIDEWCMTAPIRGR